LSEQAVLVGRVLVVVEGVGMVVNRSGGGA
jgi:hypothetical protein